MTVRNTINPNRRAVLAGAASSVMLPSFALGASHSPVELRPSLFQSQLLPDAYPQTQMWGYGGTAPGPEIRVAQGARIERRLVNDLPQPTSIHWHGIRIDNKMDGVPGLTQAATAPGEMFDYAFEVPDAGTYWYHAHNQSTEQVARGLFGALIVEEANAPEVDQDVVLILDDWLMLETGEIDPDFAAAHDRSHAGRLGNFVTTNGTFALEMPVRHHYRLRLRLINAANARIFPLTLQGLEGWIVALDGMPLSQPERLTSEIILGPGQRVDLIVDVKSAGGETAYLVRLNEDTPQPQVIFPVSDGSAANQRPVPAALAPNPSMDLPDLARATRTQLVMEEGAMGGLSAAIVDGNRESFRQIAQKNMFWAFNGVVGMTDTPLIDAALGEQIALSISNHTVFPHAMHLHGIHFREIMEGEALGPMRDTLLLGGRETREIAFIADNPGDWLFHCHMLSHADAGMMAWIRVRA